MRDNANQLIKSLNELDFLDKESITKISTIFSPRIGIINALLKRRELSIYGLHMFQSLSSNVTELFGRKREISSGGLGVGFSEKDAFWACIGETIERYCISYYDSKDFVYKRLTDLPTREIDRF